MISAIIGIAVIAAIYATIFLVSLILHLRVERWKRERCPVCQSPHGQVIFVSVPRNYEDELTWRMTLCPDHASIRARITKLEKRLSEEGGLL